MSIRDRVIQVLEETIGRGRTLGVADSDSLLANGLIDSLSMIELVNALPQRFGVTVEDDELMPENLDSVEAITAYLRRKGVAE